MPSTKEVLDRLEGESAATIRDAVLGLKAITGASSEELQRTEQRLARLRESTPPTTEAPCPACSGRGSVIIYDAEAMAAKRKALRLSQSAVARAVGWQASIVSELESGARPMTEASAQRYWKALHEAEKSA